MQNKKANSDLEAIITEVEKNGIKSDKLITKIQEVRELAKLENDPLVTRALRLTWQHLESNGGFTIPLAEEIESAEENFTYFLSLCIRCENEINREELREMTNSLQELA
ncbi:MAG: hypothetical protein ACON5K_00965 [Bacteroidia bacterium]